MGKCNKIFVGMDVHKDSIEIALAEEGAQGEVRRYGRIGGDLQSLAKAVRKLQSHGAPLHFVYEAGPCGYGIYRYLTGKRLSCDVVAPSLTPRRPGERIKTDRRDGEKLARLARAGELSPVYVPDGRDEAIRDLVRAREDAKVGERRARQQLKALLLRQDIRYVGKSAWTSAHLRWLAGVKLPHPAQQVAFQEYVEAVTEGTQRVDRLTRAITEQINHWRWLPVLEALQALRGIQLVHAVTLVAEIGSFARFDNPRELMGFLGLVPSEHSSAEHRRQGAITKAGNSHVRRALIEAAWQYRQPARVSRIIAQRQTGLPKPIRDIAWKAQLRLCGRFRRLAARRLNRNKVVVAIARELAGFVWAIAREVKLN